MTTPRTGTLPVFRASLALLASLALAAGPGPWGCGDSGRSVQPRVVAGGVPAPRFDKARAFTLLEKQVAFGPRCNGCPGHARARKFFVSFLEGLGAEVTLQTFTVSLRNWTGRRTFTNIVARFGDGKRSRVLIGAHYDTRARADAEPDERNWSTPIDGANDGASGVAVALELARLVSKHPPAWGVDVVLFDGEDFGRKSELPDNYFVGSREYARRVKAGRLGPAPRFAVILDMVADRNLLVPPRRIASEATKAGSVDARSQALDDAIHALARNLGETRFGGQPRGDLLDDHRSLREAGIPAAVLIFWRTPTWHTRDDVVSRCSPDALGAVGRVVAEFLYRPETWPAFSAQGKD